MRKLSVGDQVAWNSEAGRVAVKVTKLNHSEFDSKRHAHGASTNDPQYESNATSPITFPYTEKALTKIQ